MKKLIFISSLILLFGCSRSFQILQHQDKFNPGFITIYTSPITVESGSLIDLIDLKMQFGYTYSDTSAYHFLGFTYMGKGWIFMESMKLLIDGKVFDLYPTLEPKRENLTGSFVYEYLGIRIPPGNIDMMKTAKEISIRIVASKRNIDFSFDAKMKKYFNQFLASIK